jgi:ATP-dependent DNA helicase RecG
LGVVVIDEEQRFGVNQKQVIARGTNVLYTTATPIPRSQSRIVTSQMTLSTLTDKPLRKRPIETVRIALDAIAGLIDRIDLNLTNGTKIFWVCPLLQPNEMLPSSSATERFAMLSARFPGQVFLLHGEMTFEEKNDNMNKFKGRY